MPVDFSFGGIQNTAIFPKKICVICVICGENFPDTPQNQEAAILHKGYNVLQTKLHADKSGFQ